MLYWSISSCKPQEASPSVASLVPPELFQQIIDNLYDVTFEECRKDSREMLHMLSSCALTCRYWAERLRGDILHTLHLHSYRGVKRMQDVLNPPAGFRLEHPVNLVNKLHVTDSQCDPMWFYEALHIISRHPRLRARVSMELQLGRRSSPGEHVLIPSARVQLPRYLPNTFTNVHLLRLNSLQFKQASECFKFLREFQYLRYLTLDDLRWDPASSLNSSSAVPPQLHNIIVTEGDRYSHGGRGILPWMMAAIIAYSALKTVSNGPTWKNAHSAWTTLLPCNYLQSSHIMDVLSIFYDRRVTHILESEDKIQWHINKWSLCSNGDAATCA